MNRLTLILITTVLLLPIMSTSIFAQKSSATGHIAIKDVRNDVVKLITWNYNQESNSISIDLQEAPELREALRFFSVTTLNNATNRPIYSKQIERYDGTVMTFDLGSTILHSNIIYVCSLYGDSRRPYSFRF